MSCSSDIYPLSFVEKQIPHSSDPFPSFPFPSSPPDLPFPYPSPSPFFSPFYLYPSLSLFFFQNPARWSGERCELPQQSPNRNWIWLVLLSEKSDIVRIILATFTKYYILTSPCLWQNTSLKFFWSVYSVSTPWVAAYYYTVRHSRISQNIETGGNVERLTGNGNALSIPQKKRKYPKSSNKRPRCLFEQSTNTPAFSGVPACESSCSKSWVELSWVKSWIIEMSIKAKFH